MALAAATADMIQLRHNMGFFHQIIPRPTLNFNIRTAK